MWPGTEEAVGSSPKVTCFWKTSSCAGNWSRTQPPSPGSPLPPTWLELGMFYFSICCCTSGHGGEQHCGPAPVDPLFQQRKPEHKTDIHSTPNISITLILCLALFEALHKHDLIDASQQCSEVGITTTLFQRE